VKVVELIDGAGSREIGAAERRGKLAGLVGGFDLRPGGAARGIDRRIGNPGRAVVNEFVTVAANSPAEVVAAIRHIDADGGAAVRAALDEDVLSRCERFAFQERQKADAAHVFVRREAGSGE
jgi:hypothetical protein